MSYPGKKTDRDDSSFPTTDKAALGGETTPMYSQDRGYARLMLDTFEGWLVVGRRRGETATMITNLDAKEAKELTGGIKIDEKSPLAQRSDRIPSQDPRLYNEPGYMSPPEHGAAREAARDAEPNPSPPPTADEKYQLKTTRLTDAALLDNPGIESSAPNPDQPMRTDAAAKDYPRTEAQAKLSADPDVGSMKAKKGLMDDAARKSVVKEPVIKGKDATPDRPGIEMNNKAPAKSDAKPKAETKAKARVKKDPQPGLARRAISKVTGRK